LPPYLYVLFFQPHFLSHILSSNHTLQSESRCRTNLNIRDQTWPSEAVARIKRTFFLVSVLFYITVAVEGIATTLLEKRFGNKIKQAEAWKDHRLRFTFRIFTLKSYNVMPVPLFIVRKYQPVDTKRKNRGTMLNFNSWSCSWTLITRGKTDHGVRNAASGSRKRLHDQVSFLDDESDH